LDCAAAAAVKNSNKKTQFNADRLPESSGRPGNLRGGVFVTHVMTLKLVRIFLLLPMAACCGAQELTQTMTRLDAAVFDAYNQCRMAEFVSYFSEDVEFYHDQSGQMTGRKRLVEAVEKNICGKVRRGLVSIEVYPMKGYGAVVKGVHRFYPASDPKAPATGEAKFFHLWELKDGAWRMTRVVSYDHVALKQ
jgi:hypothetical protein